MDRQLVLRYVDSTTPKFYFSIREKINGKEETNPLGDGSIKTYIEGPKGKNNRFVVFSNYPIHEWVEALDTREEAIKTAYKQAIIIGNRLMAEFHYPEIINETPFSKQLGLESMVSP